MAVLFRREPPANPGSAWTSGSIKTPDSGQPARTGPSIEQIIKQRLVTVEFQPIVRLATGEVVAFESLARGPANGALAMPTAMFQAAAEAGMVAELDAVAHAAVYWALQHSSVDPSVPIFINSNPLGLLATAGNEGEQVFPSAPGPLRIAVELGEFGLVSDPIGTLTAIAYARRRGVKIAIDNVGGALESLALLPFAQPDVVKLDPMLVTDDPLRATQVFSSLVGHVMHGSPLLVAQGIEREEQVPAAHNTGAALGQGYHFGHPMTVAVAEAPREPLDLDVPYQAPEPGLLPFEMLREHRAPMQVDATMLHNLATLMEDTAKASNQPFVLVHSIPAGMKATDSRLKRLRGLSRSASLLLVLAAESSVASTPDLRIDQLGAQDPLRGEMVLAVLSPHMSSLLVARPAAGDRSGNLFDCVLTHDRAPVIRVSRALVDRVTSPAPQR